MGRTVSTGNDVLPGSGLRPVRPGRKRRHPVPRNATYGAGCANNFRSLWRVVTSASDPPGRPGPPAPRRRAPRPRRWPNHDRNYAIDAFRGAAIADYRAVGMGGVSLATAEGATGLLVNPAAAASRPATASSWFYWDFLLDAYTPGLGVDFDNNGTSQDQFSGKAGALNAG